MPSVDLPPVNYCRFFVGRRVRQGVKTRAGYVHFCSNGQILSNLQKSGFGMGAGAWKLVLGAWGMFWVAWIAQKELWGTCALRKVKKFAKPL